MSVPSQASLETKLPINVRRCLSKLLSSDLDFHRDASNLASHALHAFAAKFPPQLPRVFIEGLTVKGETVMDPMMGSGTAIVEAFLCGLPAMQGKSAYCVMMYAFGRQVFPVEPHSFGSRRRERPLVVARGRHPFAA